LIGDCARGKAWRRLALPGDHIVVVGALGEAAAGLELLRAGRTGKSRAKLVRAFTRPRPRLDVAAALAGHPGVRGAIDVSDGLSTDLIHICDASGVGCEVDATALPVSPALAAFCRARDTDLVDWILRGGEDYALRFTGREAGRQIVRDGKRSPLKASGWDHLRRA
jgi:thiamine-monophosphate kinase